MGAFEEDPYGGAAGEEKRLWERRLSLWLSLGFAGFSLAIGLIGGFGLWPSLAAGCLTGLAILLPCLAATSADAERRRNWLGLVVALEVLLCIGFVIAFLVAR